MYCGEEWSRDAQEYYFDSKRLKCGKCGDTQIKTRKDIRDVDYYDDNPEVEQIEIDYGSKGN